MTVLKNDRILRALMRQPVDCTPIWIMRQAGRYLPEYRASRKKAGNFSTLYKTPTLACEVTLQPVTRYDLDAAILFSDILVVPEALGLTLHFVEGHGPQFSNPLQNAKEITALARLDPARLQYVYDSIHLVQHELKERLPLIGFCGSPWTLAAYMVQGSSIPGFPRLQALKKEYPALLHALLEHLTQAVGLHLAAQIQAGVQAVMIFDTWGGLLETEEAYELFSLQYIKQMIAEYLHQTSTENRPIILFTKGGQQQWLERIATSGCHAISLDAQHSLKKARQCVGDRVALQGNLDSTCLLKTPAEIQHAVAVTLEEFGSGSGHVFNLGHGITPDVPPEHVNILVNAVHELSLPYHRDLISKK